MTQKVPLLNSNVIYFINTMHTKEEIESYIRSKNLFKAFDKSKNTLLHEAARTKNTILANVLIESGGQIDLQNNFGQTPLTLAIENGCEDTVEILMTAGASIYIANNYGENALKLIGQIDKVVTTKILRLFLQKLQNDCLNVKEDIAKKLKKANWSLHKIIQLKDAELTRVLLQHGYESKINLPARFSGETALHVAVKSVDVENVNVLLDYNAQMLEDCYRCKPSSSVYDCSNSYPNERLIILKKLIERGVFVGNQVTRRDYDIYEYASREAVKLLLETYVKVFDNLSFKMNVLRALSINKNADAIEEVCGKEFFDNIPYHIGMTMWLAIETKFNTRTIEILLNELADVYAANESEFTGVLGTFLYHIMYDRRDEDHKECVQLFLERSLDVQLKGYYGIHELNILDIVLDRKYLMLDKLVFSHLAIQEMQGTAITQTTRSLMNSNDQFKTYFNLSKQQLSIEICNSTTLFDLLTIADKKLEIYARNDDFVAKVEDTIDVLSDYEYFRNILKRRLSKVIPIVTMKKETGSIICKIMGTRYDRLPLVADIIINYLDQEDMKNLIQAGL